ncbi:MAG: hypothetical protein HYV42_05560 [Candidatus Magasanikbacteria bacterium]|nr:hypothetical protein [Candidatus Magasanikbacteria bacterium]
MAGLIGDLEAYDAFLKKEGNLTAYVPGIGSGAMRATLEAMRRLGHLSAEGERILFGELAEPVEKK